MPNINEFTGKYRNLSRVNRFRVEGFNIAGGGQDLQFFAKGATLPATNVGVLDVPYQGRLIKLDGDRTYEDFTITIMDNEGMGLRRQFEEWSNEYNDPENNVSNQDFAYRTGFVTLLGRDDSESIKFEIVDAVCYNVAQVDLGWDQNDQILEFQVTIGYNYHRIV